jgi:RNA polymerase sigma-70 factor (ECF subfamily)
MADFIGKNDEELMLAVKAGDRDAFGILYARHRNGVLNFCYQMLRNFEDSGDVFQEAFRYLFVHADTYTPSAKFTTYLYRIARNLCIDILRRRKRWNLQQLDTQIDVQDDSPTRTTVLESDETQGQVKKALEEIPEPYREVVLLRVVHGMAYEDIATTTQSPLGTVKSRLHTGFEFLRQSLKRKKLIE